MIDDNTVTIAEHYITANAASNLRVEADKGGAADILICAGWTPSREVGAALLRLHTKHDRAGLSFVHAKAVEQAAWARFERPDAVASAVLAWWLVKVCKACTGKRFELVPGTPALSARHCKSCKGTGEITLPHGENGKRLERWLDESVERAQASIKKRLYALHQPV